MDKNSITNYSNLVSTIADTYIQGKAKALKAVNTTLIETYWLIGQHLVEFEQGGNTKAAYGAGLLENLSKDLSLSYGKGFSLSNIKRFRQFYLTYPIGATLSHQLTWSHYIELLKIDHELERSFYEKQTAIENWSVRELKRQKETSLFLRLAAGKKQKRNLAISQTRKAN